MATFRGQADAGTDAPGAAAGLPVAPPAEMPLIIEADARTPHQAVMTALDVSSQLGLRRVSFAASRGAVVP
jgi:biopolymer transport protein ExbD